MKTIRKIGSILLIASALITISAFVKAKNGFLKDFFGPSPNELHNAVVEMNVGRVKQILTQKNAADLIKQKGTLHNLFIYDLQAPRKNPRFISLSNVTPLEVARRLKNEYEMRRNIKPVTIMRFNKEGKLIKEVDESYKYMIAKYDSMIAKCNSIISLLSDFLKKENKN